MTDFKTSIDGKKCKTKKAFLQEIGLAFKFPTYYGQNLDALDECINDLDWLASDNYYLTLKNFNKLLIEEPVEIKDAILDLLDKTSNEWANVPNYEGEEKYRKKSNFIVDYRS